MKRPKPNWIRADDCAHDLRLIPALRRPADGCTMMSVTAVKPEGGTPADMRLDQAEKKALQNALRGIEGEVYLFGSRLDEDLRGGDIDVLILSEEDPFALSRKVAARFFMECEEKIDVLVMSPTKRTSEQQAFLNTLRLGPFNIAV